MPVGAIIGGVASIGGALLSSSSNSKAIDKASDAQAAATREATQLQRDIYQQNVGYQTPYLNTGNAAMAQMNALLGLQTPAIPAYAPQTPGGTQTTQPVAQEPVWSDNLFQRFAQKARWQQQQNQQQQPVTPPLTTPTITQPTAQAAYDAWKANTGYTTRLNEGMNALNAQWAGRGTLQSGAAGLAFQRAGQDYATNQFGQYYGMLAGQQQLGPGAANALSGVGTNYANAAGNLAIQNGNNIANAAVASANNRNQLYGGIAQGIGGIAGSIFGGSSFGG